MFALDVQDQILDKLNTLVVVLTTDGRIDYVSRSAQQLLGYRSQDLLGNNWWEMTRSSKPEGELVKRKILQALSIQQDSTQTFEHELRTAAGGEKMGTLECVLPGRRATHRGGLRHYGQKAE
jgi:PAS domain S-box-containing protein